MSFQLRPYQQQAVEAVIEHFRQHNHSALIILPTGAGKSLVIAELANKARGRILILTHVKELVEQNQQKLQTLGIDAGVFSAGLGEKNSQNQITVASIQSAFANLEQFQHSYSLVIIDEAHRISQQQQSQYQQLLKHLQQYQTELKILGLTATAYRLQTGWIYRYHYRGFLRESVKPFFHTCIFELSLASLIRQKYLTPVQISNIAVEHYDFSELQHDWSTSEQVAQTNALLRRYPRVTQGIIADIEQKSTHKLGVIIFAATVEHAFEIQQYIGQNSAVICSQTPMPEREQIINEFKQQNIKFLINVSVLTTGFDAPHVDVIAILRATESVSLYQQMIGRGLRLSPKKSSCLVLDYAGNDYDIFSPDIGEIRPNKNSQVVQVFCPQCEFANQFWGKLDADGDMIEHYGRRCMALDTQQQQCTYRFVFKQCPQCQQENDIAARRCSHCQHQLIDADDLLKKALKLKGHRVFKIQAMQVSCQQQQLTITFYDEDGLEISEQFNADNAKQWHVFNQQYQKRIIGKPAKIRDTEHALKLEFKSPDFVICKQEKYYLKLLHKIYDYQGNISKANSL